MQLVQPSTTYQTTYIKALEEGKDEVGLTKLHKPEIGQSFEDFIKILLERANGQHLPEGYVPDTEFWLVDGDEFIGRINIRHTLTDSLLKIGGHIGYYIRPSKRNMGYGKKILQLVLPEAKKLGIEKALVTCDDDNIGSRKIIEENGGVLENIIDNGDFSKKRRYWITLS